MFILASVVLSIFLSEPSRYFFNKLHPPIRHIWIYTVFPIVEWWMLLFLNVGNPTAFGIIFELAITAFLSSAIVLLWSIICYKFGRNYFEKLRSIVCIVLAVIPVILRYIYPPLYS